MQNQGKSKNKLLKFLPKPPSPVIFQNLGFSPRRDKRSDIPKTHFAGKGFSGPIISIIPVEARAKLKNSSFEAREPTSPKVSCMGQIKHRKKQVSIPKEFIKTFSSPPPKVVKKKPLTIRNIFKSSSRRTKSDAAVDNSSVLNKAPSLSQMRRFASSRDAFVNFDWTVAQIAPEDSDYDHHRNYDSDEERKDSEGEEEEVIIPFSAPILMNKGETGVTLEPRKEINIWKRRTMAQPTSLQLNKPTSLQLNKLIRSN